MPTPQKLADLLVLLFEISAARVPIVFPRFLLCVHYYSTCKIYGTMHRIIIEEKIITIFVFVFYFIFLTIHRVLGRQRRR